ncbi:MAG: hypothetical protein ACI8WB_000858 [Phenylobacterium sp.]|jgi:hypothetical protein
MATELFLNTAYVDELFVDSTMAAQGFSEAVFGLKKAISYGAANYLVSAADADNTLLAFDYTIRDWISDRRTKGETSLVDRDLQRYFARKLDSVPFCDEDLYANDNDFLTSEVEIRADGSVQANVSATLAFLRSGILLSPGLFVFNQPYVDAFVSALDESIKPVKVRCICSELTAVEHATHIQQLAGLEVACANDIWQNRTQLFPHLQFCSRVEKQLDSLHQWNVVLQRLFELEIYARHWRSGAFDEGGIPSKVTGEGEQVRANHRAKKERTFTCPDNQQRLFLWHSRATPGAIRIYFYPLEESQNKGVIIGHIGAKPYYPA